MVVTEETSHSVLKPWLIEQHGVGALIFHPSKGVVELGLSGDPHCYCGTCCRGQLPRLLTEEEEAVYRLTEKAPP